MAGNSEVASDDLLTGSLSTQAVSGATQATGRGRLQLVASPIGNLGDITFRAVESLKNANVIACEDTRHTSRLLNHIGVKDKELVALHEHNEQHRSGRLVERALNGEVIAYVSDAGMPTISDPGYRIVRASYDAGVPVEVIPGACAVVTALAGSGMPTDAFYFGGFLPVKLGRRSNELTIALERKETSIYYESPHRLLKTLNALCEIEPEREICVARELTKKFESFHRGQARELQQHFSEVNPKGEITFLIQGKGKRKQKRERSRPETK